MGAIETLQLLYHRYPEIFRKGFKPEDFKNPDQLDCIEETMLSIKRSPMTASLRRRASKRRRSRY